MICASTAARSASTAARPSTSATPGSSSQSNRRPSSAAAWMMRRAVGSSAASRWRIDCSTSMGIDGDSGPVVLHRVVVEGEGAGGHQARRGAPPRGTGCRRCGRSIQASRSGGTASVPRQAATTPRTSSGGSAADVEERDVVVSPEARQGLDHPPSGRVVQRQSTGWSRRVSARYSTTASVSTSAQCRSSRMSRVAGLSWAASWARRTTASARSTGDSSVPPAPSSRQLRHEPAEVARRTRPAADRAAAMGRGSATANASVSGRYGTGLSPGTQRPASTAIPSCSARSGPRRGPVATCRRPASPTSTTTPP